MTPPLKVVVRFNDEAYHAAIDPTERVDQLLLRSLYHFGIDPVEKEFYRLIPVGTDRPRRELVLDHAAGEQLDDGFELALDDRRDLNRPLATGSY